MVESIVCGLFVGAMALLGVVEIVREFWSRRAAR